MKKKEEQLSEKQTLDIVLPCFLIQITIFQTSILRELIERTKKENL